MDQCKNKVTVIVPVYNVEVYIRECIDSIINQTYKNIELILVDDGSTDTCGVICDEYANKDKRITVVHKSNGGLSSARNAGLFIANGDFIVFVDSDDYLYTDSISYMMKTIITENVAIASFASTKLHTDGRTTNNKTDNNAKKYYGKLCADSLMTDDSFYSHAAWAKIYRKDAIKGIYFPEGLNAEDTYFSFVSSLNNEKILIDHRKSVYCYRMRQGSIVMSKEINNHSFDFYHVYVLCYNSAIDYPNIQRKCARRIVRSFISIIRNVYHSSQDVGLYLDDINKMKLTVDSFKKETKLSFIETISFYIAKYLPQLFRAF